MSSRPRWVSASCKGLALIAIAVLVATAGFAPSAAQTRIDQSASQDSLEQIRSASRLKRTVRLYGDVNWTMGISAEEFFADYRSLVGGAASGFDIPVGVSGGLSSFQFGDACIGIMAGYYRAVVRETYTYDPRTSPRPTGPEQGVSQTITMTVIPAMLMIDYFPVRRQFTGYVGAGVGLASLAFFWNEDLANINQQGARLGGVRYDETHLVPAAQVRAGVSLGFDDPLSSLAYAGVYLETGYTYIPFSAPLFEKTAETLAWSPPSTSQDYNIQAGGIVIRVGFEVILTGRNKRP